MSTQSHVSPASFGPPVAQLLRIRDLVYRVAGIFQPDNKMRFLEDRCARRMEVVGVNTLSDYYEYLTTNPIFQNEMVGLLNELTDGETCFFRNQPQIDALRNIILPKITADRASLAIPHLRIWSAGCSTGEEPYTLSMIMLEETLGRLKGWTFEILATDLNERAIAHCLRGVYDDYSTRNLTPYFKDKYLSAHGDELHVNSEVKLKIQFSRMNLLDDASMDFMQGIDIILCCNVLMYFDAASKQRVVQHFHRNLLPHGYLFMGHAESLYGVDMDFNLVHLPSTTAYVRADNKTATLQRTS